jgi:opacity protein-like surface antigen
VASGFSRTLLLMLVLLSGSPAYAQEDFALRGFADAGSRTFTATESFTAVLGSDRGLVFGGGIEAVTPWRIFASLRAARFSETGERVFVFGEEQFPLGIPTTITVVPIELTGGYRFDYGQRFVPYAGAGIGWHRYTETSQFAEDSENVEQTFRGLQVLGGVEFGLARWIGAAGELEWATVPDALSGDPNGVATEFDEDDLGGMTLRVKIVVGH